MKNILIISIFLMGMQSAWSQSAVKLRSTHSMSGYSGTMEYGTKTYFIQHSVGQRSVTGSNTVNSHALRQGFIQPNAFSGRVAESSDLNGKVYPNPFHQEFTVQLQEEIQGRFDIDIHDLTGRLVHRESKTDINQFRISTQDLASGQYLLNVRFQGRTFVAQIQKQ